jgi:rod shape-determining protein MreD
MIRFFFYLCLFLLFFLAQTSNLWCSYLSNQRFDLLLVIVLSLSLKFSHIRILVAVFLLGVAMDSVSGGPIGLYLSAYVWIYVLIRSLKAFVHFQNIAFLLCIGVIAVVMKNLFFLFVLIMGKGLDAVYYNDLTTMASQAAWSVVGVPLLVLLIDRLEQAVLVMAEKTFQQHLYRG